MREEFGYEVTPQQSLDGLCKTMHKYIEHHGHSDISLEIEGSQYEFRQHLEKYEEYEAKAKILDRVKEFATEPPFILANNEHEDYEFYAYDQILKLINHYESGESDD